MVLSNLDRDLLKSCLEGTPGGWESFVERYLGLVTYVVTSCARSRAVTLVDNVRDDLVAEVFLGLVENDFATLRRFRGKSSLGTYLVVVSRRIATRKLVQLSRQTAGTQPLTHDVPSGSVQDDLTLENSEEVQSLLAKLPETEATAIRMFHLEERTYREIGDRIGVPENSVGPLLTKARSSIRQLRAP